MSESLELWIDSQARNGPENMAIDEWLFAHRELPLLRVYNWLDGWGSYGYFVTESEAKKLLPGLKLVRRWTGGGVVDHRVGWTYTLVLPSHCKWAKLRGKEIYKFIHGALIAALEEEDVCLFTHETLSRGGICFQNAVENDVINSHGEKLAGAGQRRTRRGILHQGAVTLGNGEECALRLARQITDEVTMVTPNLPDAAYVRSW